MPKISIILPVYNVEKYIRKSIQSILDQTYQDYELLVIIDGSPDNSINVAKSFNDNRIQIFEKANGGLSDARNYGLERANGEYIYFMDSDDWIDSNLLEENIHILEKENLDFIIFGYTQDDEDLEGNVTNQTHFIPSINQYKKFEDNLKIDVGDLGIMGYAWNKIYKKSFLDQYQFRFQKGISLVEDILFNAPIYKNSNVINFNRKSYYHYINRDEPTLMKQFHLNSFELIKMKIDVLNNFMNVWQIKNFNTILSFILIQGIRYCIHNLFSFKNQLSLKDKIKYIEMMIKDSLTTKLISQYEPKSFADKLYSFCIENKIITPILLFALTKKS